MPAIRLYKASYKSFLLMAHCLSNRMFSLYGNKRRKKEGGIHFLLALQLIVEMKRRSVIGAYNREIGKRWRKGKLPIGVLIPGEETNLLNHRFGASSRNFKRNSLTSFWTPLADGVQNHVLFLEGEFRYVLNRKHFCTSIFPFTEKGFKRPQPFFSHKLSNCDLYTAN
ncbi:uncharacterized protein LOC143353203 [Halictus rubicundus]|uniref:uncharacterized protein LOC143353203 n=1 Tax=Halictus rubicundus TaxID=77578 RepID=UPI004035C873